jgi:hypothetical protein
MFFLSSNDCCLVSDCDEVEQIEVSREYSVLSVENSQDFDDCHCASFCSFELGFTILAKKYTEDNHIYQVIFSKLSGEKLEYKNLLYRPPIS